MSVVGEPSSVTLDELEDEGEPEDVVLSLMSPLTASISILSPSNKSATPELNIGY